MSLISGISTCGDIPDAEAIFLEQDLKIRPLHNVRQFANVTGPFISSVNIGCGKNDIAILAANRLIDCNVTPDDIRHVWRNSSRFTVFIRV